jgi:hypothetical protein
MELIERLSKIRRVEPTDINKAFFDEWREMKEGWSYGMTRYDVHQYGDGSG